MPNVSLILYGLGVPDFEFNIVFFYIFVFLSSVLIAVLQAYCNKFSTSVELK